MGRSNLPFPSRLLSRRGLLEIGYSTLLGSGITALPGRSSRAEEHPSQRQVKSVLFLFLFGGPSHLDTFDLKPEAPDECRGEFRPIESSAPGVEICEQLPQLAQRMHHWALVRSMTCNPTFGDHRRAVHGLLGGIDELPPGAGLAASRHDWPCWCSAVEYFRQARAGLPASVVLPGEVIDPGTGLYPGQNAGLLGSKFDPLQVLGNPADPKYRVDDSLRLPRGVTIERLTSQRALLAALDRQRRDLDNSLAALPFDRSRSAAFQVLTSSRLAEALSLENEPTAVRDRYGRNVFGQSILLARRLVEAGVPIVQANLTYHAFWDTHNNNFPVLRNLLPQLDNGVSALLDDLAASGRLEETLIVMMGEFGRTPKLVRPDGTIPHFTSAGRDHWMNCFCGLFAGAGVRGGQVIGRSDSIAAYPITTPYRHSDVAATVYSALGIDAAAEIVEFQGRPLRLNQGQAIEALYTGSDA